MNILSGASSAINSITSRANFPIKWCIFRRRVGANLCKCRASVYPALHNKVILEVSRLDSKFEWNAAYNYEHIYERIGIVDGRVPSVDMNFKRQKTASNLPMKLRIGRNRISG